MDIDFFFFKFRSQYAVKMITLDPKLEFLGLKSDIGGKFGSQLFDSNEDLISSSQGGNGAGPSKM